VAEHVGILGEISRAMLIKLSNMVAFGDDIDADLSEVVRGRVLDHDVSIVVSRAAEVAAVGLKGRVAADLPLGAVSASELGELLVHHFSISLSTIIVGLGRLIA